MKKLMIVAVLVFAFAITMNVALATGHNGQTNTAIGVSNSVTAISDTGYNNIGQVCVSGSASISTGDAMSEAAGINAINTSFAMKKVYGGQTNNAMGAENSVGAQATTGTNGITMARIGGGTSISTGKSVSKVKGINLINTSIKIGCPCIGVPTCGCAD
jgi:hypothetical protein